MRSIPERDIFIEKIIDPINNSKELAICVTQEFLEAKYNSDDKGMNREQFLENLAKSFFNEVTGEISKSNKYQIESINERLSAIIFANSEEGRQELMKYLEDIFPL